MFNSWMTTALLTGILPRVVWGMNRKAKKEKEDIKVDLQEEIIMGESMKVEVWLL